MTKAFAILSVLLISVTAHAQAPVSRSLRAGNLVLDDGSGNQITIQSGGVLGAPITLSLPTATGTLITNTNLDPTYARLDGTNVFTGDISFATGSNRTVSVASPVAGNGNTLTIESASGVGGTGGGVLVAGGFGQGGNFVGGDVTLRGGNGAGTAAGGNVQLSAGNQFVGTGAGGNVRIESGDNTFGGHGGGINLISGSGSGATGVGGNIGLTGGPAVDGVGGSIGLSGGTSTNSTGGNVLIDGGAGTGGTQGGLFLNTSGISTNLVQIGNGFGTFELKTSNLDISTAGAFTGATGFVSSGAVTATVAGSAITGTSTGTAGNNFGVKGELTGTLGAVTTQYGVWGQAASTGANYVNQIALRGQGNGSTIAGFTNPAVNIVHGELTIGRYGLDGALADIMVEDDASDAGATNLTHGPSGVLDVTAVAAPAAGDVSSNTITVNSMYATSTSIIMVTILNAQDGALDSDDEIVSAVVLNRTAGQFQIKVIRSASPGAAAMGSWTPRVGYLIINADK